MSSILAEKLAERRREMRRERELGTALLCRKVAVAPATERTVTAAIGRLERSGGYEGRMDDGAVRKEPGRLHRLCCPSAQLATARCASLYWAPPRPGLTRMSW